MSKKEIYQLVDKLEAFTGMSCQNVRDLAKGATLVEVRQAWQRDRAWFRGYADTIHTLT